MFHHVLTAACLLVLGSVCVAQPPAAFNDCNQNGVEDALDIAVGTSSDVNNNGVPDECERVEARRGRSSVAGS